MKLHGLRQLIIAGGVCVSLIACGGSGEKSSSGGGGTATTDVAGSIQSSTGSTADFEGWIMALVDQDTGESRVAEISALGTYDFTQVSLNTASTLVLLNTNYKLSSVLSMVAADSPGKVYQWFEAETATLPRIVHKGPAMEFSSTDTITITSDLADDSDSDGIPDGMETSSSSLTTDDNEDSEDSDTLGDSLSLADADEDGIENENDADIDGDGLANWFDEDDDGNGTLDVFDLDANGDVTLDTNQTIGDHYFGEEIEYIAVQVFSEPDSVMKLKFTIKLSDTAEEPDLIAVMGGTDLLDESRIVTSGETGGEESGDIWDRSLADLGATFDDSAGDGVYANKILLKTGNVPSADQVIFISVDYGTYSREFPFTFPDLTLDEIDFSYSSSNTRVTKSGDPFGDDVESYLWTVTVYDEDGGLVHSSAVQEGSANNYTIPEEDVDDSSITYSATVFAQSLEKVSGFPVYVIESEEEDLD